MIPKQRLNVDEITGGAKLKSHDRPGCFIVASARPVKTRNGQLKYTAFSMSATPVKHTSSRSAAAEAERLATKNPGVSFVVFEAVGAAATAQQVTWQ